MPSKLQSELGWKRVGYDGTYFAVQRVGCSTTPAGGDYSQLRLFMQPIGRARVKCYFTALTKEWNAFIDVLEDGKKNGEVCCLRAFAGRGGVSIGVINQKTRVVTASIKPGPHSSGVEGVVIGSVRV